MTAQAVQETKYCPDSGDIQTTLSHFWYASCTVLLAQLYKKHSVMFNSNRSLQRHEKAIYAARESLLNVLNQRSTGASKDLGTAQHSEMCSWGEAPHPTCAALHSTGLVPLFFAVLYFFTRCCWASGRILQPMASCEEAAKWSLQCQVNPSEKDRILRIYTASFHDRCGFPLGSRQMTLDE